MLHCPVRHPSRDMTEKRFLYIKQVVMRTRGITTAICPAQFCEFRSETLTSYLNHMCKQTERLPPFLFCSQTSYGRFCIFSDHLYRSNLSNIKEKGAGFPFVGWCMINTVSKIHIQIRKSARGIARRRLCQHLSWPSSLLVQVWVFD